MFRITALAFVVAYLVVLDVSINVMFNYPRDPQAIASGLQRYFEFGRSVEGKLERMTGREDAESAQTIPRGWVESEVYRNLVSQKQNDNDVLVAAYGMSHTGLLVDAIDELDDRFLIRAITAPGAPPNWSFAAFGADRQRRKADVAILGVMTDGVPGLSSTSGSTLNFDQPYAYSYPRFRIVDDELTAATPPFLDVVQYRSQFFDPDQWAEYREWLRANDKYFDALLYRASFLDHSALARLLRRAYASAQINRKRGEVLSGDGFNSTSEEVQVLVRIVSEFARDAREDGSLPIVYLVNNQGRGDHLFRLLLPVLEDDEIPYLSTHAIAPPSDPRMFLDRNSHFIPEKDTELAREIIRIVEEASDAGMADSAAAGR